MKNLNSQNLNTKKCGGIFDKNTIRDSITHLQEKTTEQKFWEDNQSAQNILKQRQHSGSPSPEQTLIQIEDLSKLLDKLSEPIKSLEKKVHKAKEICENYKIK